ncbi:UDP-glucosyl transferase family protein [Lasiodiplodia theobromae]|uniref:UDP-glucosyl transferase family protein n=1 Tax=Lasiodiplodia theobromae TaxID=45133 RepID=UPI0015C3F84B|nr:UDP-glucosyl transferase family protein [Lasiodiplodia theobromae]KAF4546790.1 UDP-glucosyl transferase family protein [Lasiodiplodia theobromae]
MTSSSPSPRAAPPEDEKWRPPSYSGTNCAVYASLYPRKDLPFTIEPNPDISGIGVILAFLITAYATLLFTICAYWTGLIPDELLSPVDRRIFRATSRRADSGWSKAFRGALRACSDQQMVTGIAILAAAFAGVQSTTVYHWRTVIYLGWMSSNVHLTTLTVALAPHEKKNRRSRGRTAARCVRLFGMLTLFALLFAALVPTTSRTFGDALVHYPMFGMWYNMDSEFAFTPADPAACLWLPEYRLEGPTTDAVLSLLMLSSGYVWKVGSLLFRPQQRALMRCETVRTVVPRQLRRVANWRLRRGGVVRFITAWPYALLVGAYVLFIAALDFGSSFAASLLMLTISLAWGSANLLLPRQLLAEFIGPDENTWEFGQVLPMLLLLLPLVSVVEEFSVATRKDEAKEETVTPAYPTHLAKTTVEARETATARSRAETFELPLLAHRRTQSSSATPSMSRAGTAATSGSSVSNFRFPAYNANIDSTSDITKAIPPTSCREIRTPNSDLEKDAEEKERANADEQKARVDEHGDRLYTSKFFKSLIWITILFILLAAAWVFVMEFMNFLGSGGSPDRVTMNASLAATVAIALILIWVAIGSLCSNVDKLL